MDRCRMQVAAKLLAKAQSTDSDAEAIALLDKSHQLLGGIIADAEREARPVTPGRPRRERRCLTDRRAGGCLGTLGPPNVRSEPAITYRKATAGLRSQGVRHVDLTV